MGRASKASLLLSRLARPSSRSVLVAFLMFCSTKLFWAATTIVWAQTPRRLWSGGLSSHQRERRGELVIEGDTITCVAVTCMQPRGATVVLGDCVIDKAAVG